MSTATATNGASTEAAFAAIAKAFGNDGSIGSTAQDAIGNFRQAGETWFAESKAIMLRSLDAFDATVNAYVELTRSLAATVRVADQAMDQAQRYAGTAAEVTAMYTNAARDLLGK
ncbi:MAG: hypothetical protein ABWZ98_08445 [Nakamurella sp.]